MGKTKKHVKSKKANVKNELSLEEVINLGGDKDDYDFLKSESEGEDVYGPSYDHEDNNIERKELQQFIKGLGFDKVEEKSVLPQEEDEPSIFERKLFKRPLTEEEKEEPVKLLEDDNSEKKKSKKSKNKFKKVQDEEISSTTVDQMEHAEEDIDESDFVGSSQSGMLIKPGAKWFSIEFGSDPEDFLAPSSAAVNKLMSLTEKVMEDELVKYKKIQEKRSKAPGSEAAWLRTVLTSGTLTDKIAALTLLIQEAPVHNLSALESLVAMSEKKGRREATMAVDTLKELFVDELLPEDRKLLSFEQHPLTKLGKLTSGNRENRNKRLLVWYYEAKLKDLYSRFIDAVQKLAQDTVPASKKKALGVIFALLSSRPEQEKRLLAMLVNKLGDPDHKIASKASYLLSQLVIKHPNMKLVVSLEVERLLFRPNVQTKAQYYGICFLHSLMLDHEENDLAARLLSTYFSFFQMFVKKGEVDSKMLRALLTGVNRVYPFAKIEKEKILEQVNTLYRVVHIVNFNTGLQALHLLYQVMDLEDSTSDRFYMALYRKLIDPALKMSAHQPLFLNLLFKAIRKDTVEKRIKAFVKRLLQVCHYMPPAFICGALVLLSEISRARHDVISVKRVDFGASEGDEDDNDDDDEEHFVDVDEDSDDDCCGKMQETVNKALQHRGHITASWLHRKHTIAHSGTPVYDSQQRNPLHCHADTECTWELRQLANHYHPSVALFAKNLLEKQAIKYPGNPLQDFTLIRFLDRFVYRNPKKLKQEEVRDTKKGMAKRLYVPQGLRGLPVNSEEYLLSGAENIPADEYFFYQYFSRHASKKPMQDDEDSDAGSVDDDEFDDFLDHYEKGLEDKEFTLDFAGEASNTKLKKGKSTEDVEDDSDDDLSDEEVDFGDDDDDDDDDLRKQFEAEMEGAGEDWEDDVTADDVDFDEEAVQFSDDDDESEVSHKRKPSDLVDDDDFMPESSNVKRKKKKSSETDLASLFASADDFAHLLEDTGGIKYDMGTSNAMAVKNARDAKQLEWETKRNEWNTNGKKHQAKSWKSSGRKKSVKTQRKGKKR